MIYILEIGNSVAKFCSVDPSGKPGKVTRIALTDLRSEHGDLSMFKPADTVIVACSGDTELQNQIVIGLRQQDIKALELKKEGALPFENRYRAGQAGIDRLANVAAAISHARSPVIIIDAGSAITFDVVDSDGAFLGGAIIPGFALQASVLHNRTASLPEVARDGDSPAIGADTETAIRSGIINGCAGAVERILRITMDQGGLAGASVIITGGDGPMLMQLIVSGAENIVLIPTLTLSGYYHLARHQYPDEF